MSMEKEYCIAVVSDIHSNADALKKVLGSVEQKCVDHVVFLGDLLTYGCQPNEVLELLMGFSTENKCSFIKGNHDQFYFDIADSISDFYKMPEFIRESIGWTSNNIDCKKFINQFDWLEYWTHKYVYFAHANPFGYGDWSYVDSKDDCVNAAHALRSKGYSVGVFGHSHRQKSDMITPTENFVKEEAGPFKVAEDAVLILNPGTVGQPRGTGYSIMYVSVSESTVDYEYQSIEFDVKNTIDKILQTSMSDATKTKLISFLGGADS